MNRDDDDKEKLSESVRLCVERLQQFRQETVGITERDQVRNLQQRIRSSQVDLRKKETNCPQEVSSDKDK
jgi:hypothetical protein